MPGGPCGIYERPPLQWTRLVVVSELPVTASARQIEDWAERVLSAATLTELLAD
jgi:hypothetical protein